MIGLFIHFMPVFFLRANELAFGFIKPLTSTFWYLDYFCPSLFRSFSLLDRVQDSVGPEAYFACLWEAVLGSPSVRLPALMYVNAKFNRRKSMHDQEYIMGNNIDHMVLSMLLFHLWNHECFASFKKKKLLIDLILWKFRFGICHLLIFQIAALCAAADDDGSTLVQRHLLDFLSSAFPLNSDHLVREDFVQVKIYFTCVFEI